MDFSSRTGSRTRVDIGDETTTTVGRRSAAARPSQRRVHPVDVALVAAVPVVLVATFLLPHEVRLSLAFSYLEPTPLTAYVSHFVHLELSHLSANLLVFLLVVPFSAWASIRSGHRRRFYAVAITVLVAFPFVLSALNVLFPRPRIGFGFSGMNLAFVGYLPHVLVDHFEAERPDLPRVAGAVLPLSFFTGTALIAVRLAPAVSLDPSTLAAWFLAAGLGSLLAMIVYLLPLLRAVVAREASFRAIVPPLVAFGGLLFVLLVLIGFPEPSASGGTILNVFLHFLGYSFGFLVPYVTFRVVGIGLDPV